MIPLNGKEGATEVTAPSPATGATSPVAAGDTRNVHGSISARQVAFFRDWLAAAPTRYRESDWLYAPQGTYRCRTCGAVTFSPTRCAECGPHSGGLVA